MPAAFPPKSRDWQDEKFCMSSIFSWLRKPSKTERLRRGATAEVSTLPSTQFAFSLFEALRPGHRNLAISPYSARVVLAMLCEGATGETRRAMMETLHLDENPDNLSNHYERLGRPLGFQSKTETERRELEMLTANSLWCDDGFMPKPNYVNTLQEHYWAEVQTVDFHSPASAGRVNRWAHEKTSGRIHSVVDSLEPFSPLVTVNAVYFKGLWEEPFEYNETQADLSAPLKMLGMSQVFDPAGATLEGISDRKPLYLMGVLQKDFVEVNEKGTEAAAHDRRHGGAALNPQPP